MLELLIGKLKFFIQQYFEKFRGNYQKYLKVLLKSYN